MQCEILRSISDIEKEEWNSIVEPDRLICSHEYLEAIENSQINDCRYFYPVIRNESGKLLAHTCLYFISTELDLFAKGVLKKGIQLIRKIWPGFLILRSIECGTPVALGNTISYANGQCPELLGEIVSAAENVAAELGVKVLIFRDFYDGELGFYDQLQQLGYRKIHNLPSTHMDVRWGNFDEYLNALRSEYRHKTLARISKFNECGCTIELVESFSSLSDVLATLWKEVFDAATEYKREFLGSAFFTSIDHYLADKAAVLVARQDGVVIGFMLELFGDETLTPLFCGLDYSVSRETGTYFNLFYRSIDLAIERGMMSIDFGITTLEPKVEFGAEIVTQYMYMKHTSALWNRIVPRIFDTMTPQPQYRLRNVFRSNL